MGPSGRRTRLDRREDAIAALKDARKAYAGNDGELGKIDEAARELGLGS